MTYNQFLQKLQKAAKGQASQDELNELWAYQSENEVDLNADELALITPVIPTHSETAHLQMIGRGLRKPNKDKRLANMLYATKEVVDYDSIIILPNLESISDSNFENCEKL